MHCQGWWYKLSPALQSISRSSAVHSRSHAQAVTALHNAQRATSQRKNESIRFRRQRSGDDDDDDSFDTTRSCRTLCAATATLPLSRDTALVTSSTLYNRISEAEASSPSSASTLWQTAPLPTRVHRPLAMARPPSAPLKLSRRSGRKVVVVSVSVLPRVHFFVGFCFRRVLWPLPLLDPCPKASTPTSLAACYCGAWSV